MDDTSAMANFTDELKQCFLNLGSEDMIDDFFSQWSSEIMDDVSSILYTVQNVIHINIMIIIIKE